MAGRTFKSKGYRYGFNGKENDADGEWGRGLIQDYGFRLYNPAASRFLSVDPLRMEYPELTVYQFASNTPIQAIDIDGLEGGWIASFRKMFGTCGITQTTEGNIKRNFDNKLEQFSRLSTDALTITGGVLSIYFSGGATTPIVLGGLAVGGGTAKFVYDARGEYEKADNTPTSISGVALMTIEYSVGGKVFTKELKSTVEFTEGVLTLNYSKLYEFHKLSKTDKTVEAISIINFTIAAKDMPENLRSIFTKKYQSSKLDQAGVSTAQDALKSPLDYRVAEFEHKLKNGGAETVKKDQ